MAFVLAGIYLLLRKPRPHDDSYAKESDYQAKLKAEEAAAEATGASDEDAAAS